MPSQTLISKYLNYVQCQSLNPPEHANSPNPSQHIAISLQMCAVLEESTVSTLETVSLTPLNGNLHVFAHLGLMAANARVCTNFSYS